LKSRRGALIVVVLLMSSVCAAQSNSKTEDIASTRGAAEAGDPKRQYELGSDYYFGTHGVPKDCGEAFKWLRKAGENGDGETQRAVAFIFQIFQNDGSEGSEREAIYWYMQSGAQHNFLATSNLYSYCVSGRLTQQDCSDVLKWLRQLAGSTGTQAA
jgi:TPR repeat protein